MTKTLKESQVYLNFLKSFWRLFLVLIVINATLSFWYGFNQPKIKFTEVQLGVEYSPNQITSNSLIADQVVGELRSVPIHNELQINQDSKVTTHKNGPLLVDLRVENPELYVSSQDAQKLTDYIVNKYKVTKLGVITRDESSAWFQLVYLLLGAVFGFAVALITSLIKTYLKNY